MTPMILDVDTGTDDAMALLLALRCPEIEVLAVTCVNGNCGVEQVLKNTLCVLDAAEASSTLPVAQGFGEPLVAPKANDLHVHGKDGLGDLQPPLPHSSRKPNEQHAVQVMLDALRASSLPVTVVALAPLTNVAIAIRTEPDLWREKCRSLVWMGGSVRSGGNASAWGEANAFHDPEAAHVVLSSGLPLLLYPWDVFLSPAYSHKELVQLGILHESFDNTQPRPGCQPWSQLAGRLMHFLMRNFKNSSSTIGDAGAVVAAMLPEAMTIQKLYVQIEMSGSSTRGMTVCDLRPSHGPDSCQVPNADVVMDIDIVAVKNFFTRHVLQESFVNDACKQSIENVIDRQKKKQKPQ